MTVYISPSSKEYMFSPTTNETEAKKMYLLATELQIALKNIGIDSAISPEGTTPSQSVSNSNSMDYALHLILSSFVSADDNKRGIEVLFNSTNGKSRDYAVTIAENLKQIYPLPQLINLQPNNSFIELTDTKAPSVALFLGNCRNEEDERWLSENIGNIAQNIAFSIGKILGVTEETVPMTAIGIINSPRGFAEVRKSPSPTANVIMRITNGTPIRIIGKIGNWYAAIAENSDGYILASEVTAETPENKQP